MSIDTKSRHITKSGGNVFADLGFEPNEAAALLADSKRVISEKLAIKERLMTEISGWIEEKHLLQADAARILGVTRPRVSDVVQKNQLNLRLMRWSTCSPEPEKKSWCRFVSLYGRMRNF